MEKTGNDFTNTFRLLSSITKDDNTNKHVIDKLIEQAAPKDFFVNKYRHQYSDNPKVRAILANNPDVLRYYGVDPDELKKELEKSDKAIADLDQNFDTVTKAEFSTLWREWVTEYVKVLGGIDDAERKVNMNKSNPSFILRNYLMEQAIRKAE